ncbi:Pollen Ole e 1 allergen/extensin [Macleaya cordata]|uniref:Pollen Ole e 1 allergen/extensin n=1 Tax=Macleaya cordata TaxID=56857 RepID=A0A200R747_MACCD|nr:Pollen Ole e 1 allergen/extensin [Macleaya cordata]
MKMKSPNYKLFIFGVFMLLAAVAVDEANGDAMVTGTVFCDQCKDGERSLFDYPLSGMKVAVACSGSDGQVKMWKEETTNWFGNYAFSFDGSPDLSGCYATLSGGGSGQQGSTGCGAAAGPAQGLKLMFKMFDTAIYAVDSLLSQPVQPMPFCPRSASPPPGGVQPPAPPSPSSPTVKLPPMPFLQASACPYEEWTKPEYKCYWKVVEPDTKVAVAFGLIAAGKYGTDMTLREGLQGRGDLYRTLLREATTALLNSYNSVQFRYPTLSVIEHMNWALMGSTQQALQMALRFKRANYGNFGDNNNNNNVRCNFTPCKE